jgi:hypothetical protein
MRATQQAIGYQQLQSALADVRRELMEVGLWYGGRISQAEVVLCRRTPPDLRDAAAFFVNRQHMVYRAFGCEPGHIYVPQGILGQRERCGSLRDVLRHEFGHALAFYHPGLIRRRRAFVAAFDARYDDQWIIPPTNAEDFVTPYAMTAPDEDFAETFMVWLRTCGRCRASQSRCARCPSRGGSPALRAKFRFVRDLCHRLSR